MIDLNDLKATIAAGIGLLGAALGSTMDIIVSFLQIPTYVAINFFGSFVFIQTDVALQRLAWTIGIIAALVSIINGMKNWKLFKFFKKS